MLGGFLWRVAEREFGGSFGDRAEFGGDHLEPEGDECVEFVGLAGVGDQDIGDGEGRNRD